MSSVLLLLSACGNSSEPDSGDTPSPSNSPTAADTQTPLQTPEDDASVLEKSFGYYSIAEDWFESEVLSGDDMFFYLKDGTSIDTPTSNISVSAGENKYGEDDFQSFAQAIDQQLKTQIGSDVTEYFGGGSYTENDYPLITMTIGDGEIRTIQYYIVGDYRHVMVHATDFGDEKIPDVEEAALAIVNSFVWAE